MDPVSARQTFVSKHAVLGVDDTKRDGQNHFGAIKLDDGPLILVVRTRHKCRYWGKLTWTED